MSLIAPFALLLLGHVCRFLEGTVLVGKIDR
jgi:hypothetical protein